MDLNHAHRPESITAPVTDSLLAMTTLLPGLTATFCHLVAGISQPCHPMAKLPGLPFMISTDPAHPFALISVFSSLAIQINSYDVPQSPIPTWDQVSVPLTA